MNSTEKFKKVFLITMLSVALAACGGGGGGGSGKQQGNNAGDAGQTPNAGDDQTNSVGVNGAGNTGYIYYTDRSRIVRHNVVTGERQFYIDTYFSFAESAGASDDGSLFAAFGNNYKELDIYNTESKQLLHWDAGYEIDFAAPVSFSPDNKYFMVRRVNHYSSGDFDQLEFYDIAGNRMGYVKDSISAWDWLSNDEIIIASGDTIYRWSLSGGAPVGEPKPIITLGGDSIWDLSISPDKSKIAFIKRGATAHIVDIAGGGDKKIAAIITDSPTDKWVADLVSVRWSPDSKSILVGGRGINMMYGIRNSTYISIFPIDSETVLDTGDEKYWLVKKDGDGYYYTSESDLYSMEWLQN